MCNQLHVVHHKNKKCKQFRNVWNIIGPDSFEIHDLSNINIGDAIFSWKIRGSDSVYARLPE